MLFISLAKRFIQKSNLLRFIFSLGTNFEFHFHGIKSLRSLRIRKFFCTYFLSFSRNFWVEFSFKGTSFLRSVIGAFKNIKHSLFVFPSNTYSYELENSVPKFQAYTGEVLIRIRNFRNTYFYPMDVTDTDGEGLTLLNMNYK